MSRRASREDVEALFRQHADEVHGYLHRRAGAAGADLLGEVFLVALRRIDDLPQPDLRRAWLFGTARRLLLAQARDETRRTQAEDERARTHVPVPTTSTDHAAVRAAITRRTDVDARTEPRPGRGRHARPALGTGLLSACLRGA